MPHADHDPQWLAWAREQSEWRCLICDRPAEVCHLDSAGMGGGQGSDQWVMPLCHEHHMESHQRPEWWYRHRKVLARWWAELPFLRERYAIGRQAHGERA